MSGEKTKPGIIGATAAHKPGINGAATKQKPATAVANKALAENASAALSASDRTFAKGALSENSATPEGSKSFHAAAPAKVALSVKSTALPVKAALIGKPLSHSYSAEIHRMLGTEYVLRETEEDELPLLAAGKEMQAFNVTIPYKEKILPLLSRVDERALAVGAVNTVVIRGGESVGYNTDISGMEESFARAGVSVKGKNAVVLGSGGTSKTARAFLASSGAKKITVVSRKGEWNYDNYRALTDTEILVNTTPVGMFPKEDACPVDLAAFPKIEFVFDVVYHPLRTNLVLDAESVGIPAMGGLYMLVAQAAFAEELVCGAPVGKEKIEEIYRAIRKQKSNLVLVGMPSSGKTTVGEKAAKLLGYDFIDLDKEMERETGLSVPEIFAARGEAAFREIEAAAAQKFAKRTGAVIATGGGTPLNPQSVRALQRNGTILYLERDLKLLLSDGRPVSQREGVSALFEKRRPVYEGVSSARVKNEGDIEAVAAKVVSKYEKLLAGN